MSTFRLSDFTSAVHTLVVEPSGVFFGRERWRFDLWCGETLVFSQREFETPSGWGENTVAAHALFWATFPPEECESARYEPTSWQRAWLDSDAEYLTLALLSPDGQEIDDLSAYRVND